jgi:hypothetical protein
LSNYPLAKPYGESTTLKRVLEKRAAIEDQKKREEHNVKTGAFVNAALDPTSQNELEALKGSGLGSLPKELRQHIVNDMAAASAQDKNPPHKPANLAPGVPAPKG